MDSALIKLVKNFKKAKIGVVLVKPAAMKKLNEKYREIARPTTVLSFSQLEGQVFPKPSEEEIYLGDIIICPQEAQKQGLSLEFLINHGIKSLLSTISATKNLRT